MGLGAIQKIERFIEKFGNDCNFSLRPTFLYTNSIFAVPALKDEFEFRRKNGFACKLYEKDTNPFPFPIKCGIYAKNGGCEFNPYLFTKMMLEHSKNQNKIFENTNITKLIKTNSGYIAVTNFGERICCKKILVATGFNWEVLQQDDLCERFVTYSIVTSPVKDFSWKEKALIHDSTSPYHYLRTLPDGRIIFGSEDTTFKGKPINEKKVQQKI